MSYITAQALTKTNEAWSGTLNNLPVGNSLNFVGHATNASNVEIFTGMVTYTLTGTNDTLSLSLNPVDDGVVLLLPKITITALNAVNTEASSTIQVAVEGNSGETLAYLITPAVGGGTFNPSSGNLTLSGTSGSFTSLYTAPSTTGTFTHTLNVTNAQGNSTEVEFGIALNDPRSTAEVTINFAPVLTALKAKRSGSNILWTAVVNDDGDSSALRYLWSFDGGTLIDTTANPSTLTNYTTSTTGTMVLKITDQNGSGASSTVSYWLPANQFAISTNAEINIGNGSDGSLIVNGDVNLNTNGHAPKFSVSSISTNSVILSESIAGIASEDEILLINLQGSATAYNNVGNYEFLQVQSITGNSVTFTTNVSKIYGATTNNSVLTDQKIMLQRVPHYTDLTVLSGYSLSVSAWDGNSGGVLALRVSGTLQIQSGGKIDVNGLGYRGGGGIEWGSYSDSAWQGESYAGLGVRDYHNNFGGGGGGHGGNGNWIGAGGSYGSKGIEDVNYDARAGAVYGDSSLSQLFLGSGAGGRQSNWDWCQSSGGNGGGIAMVFSNTISVNGTIQSNGTIAFGRCGTPNDTSSASGSGGSILIQAGNFTTDKLGVTATGFAGPFTTAGWWTGGAGRISIYSGLYTPLSGSNSYYFVKTTDDGFKAVTILSYESGVQYQVSTKGSGLVTSGSLNEGQHFEIKDYNLPFNELIKIEVKGNGIVYHTDSLYTYADDGEIVLAKGKNSFVDTEFYIRSPITGYSPRLVVVGIENGTTLNIDDISDNDDDVNGISLNKGGTYVKVLNGVSTLHLTSTGKIYAYWGIIGNYSMEVIPTVTGNLVGNEFYAATPSFIGVMPLENGNMTITRIRDGAVVYNGAINKGSAIYTNNNAGFNSNGWAGVEVLHVTSDVPVYSWISNYNDNNKMYGSMPIPPVNDSYKEFYAYAQGHSSWRYFLNIHAYDNNTTVVITDLTDGSASATTTLNAGEFFKSPGFNGHNLHIETSKRATVVLFSETAMSAGAMLSAGP
ncbi:hypothetical protein WDW89_10145 [Deltaproteobacteria bacterium TL4]